MVVPAETQTTEAKEYVIPRYAVDHLLESFQIVRTDLSEVLEIPDTNRAEWSDYAEKWWAGQKPEDQHVLRRIINALGAPSLVSNLTVMRGNERMINTRAVFTSTRLDDPAFMVGVDEEGNNYHVTYMESGSIIAATMMMYLDAGMEFGETKFKLTMGVKDLLTFMGVMDLYKRSSYISMLEHTTQTFKVMADEIINSVDDGAKYPDMRWNLPFVIMQITNDVQPPTKAEVNASIQVLVQRGVLKREGEAYSLTEPGLFCAKTLMKVHNKVNIMSVGFNESGKPARKGAAFIRSDPVLWAISVEPDTVIFSSMDLDTAAEIVYELMTPAMPEEKTLTEEAATQAPICPKCGKPATWVEQYKRWYCHSCQEYLEA